MPTPENNLKRLGASGETVARAHLEQWGWRLLEANFRCAQGELDLIAEETTPTGVVTVFIEVKTRRGSAHGTPAAAVDTRKQQRLIRVAQAWLAAQNAGGEEPACRFDVAEVRFGPDGLARVQWQRAAFDASF